MFDKEFFPTTGKLSRLRREGILPYNSLVTRLLQLAIILSVLLVWKSDLLSALQLKVWLNFKSSSLIFEQLKPVGKFFITLLFVTFFTTILVGLLQNKFYFNLNLVSFNTKNFWFRNKLDIFPRSLSLLVQLLFAFVSTSLLAYVFAPKVIKLLQIDRLNLGSLFEQNETNYYGVLILVWLVILALTVLSARFFYYFKHRMSQKEMHKELSSD